MRSNPSKCNRYILHTTSGSREQTIWSTFCHCKHICTDPDNIHLYCCLCSRWILCLKKFHFICGQVFVLFWNLCPTVFKATPNVKKSNFKDETEVLKPLRVPYVGIQLSCRMWRKLMSLSIPFHHLMVHFGFLNVSWCLNHMSLNMMTTRSSNSMCSPLKIVSYLNYSFLVVTKEVVISISR